MTHRGIHAEIIEYVEEALKDALLEDISWANPAVGATTGDTKAGVVQIGPIQGDPDLDEARIVVTIHENDPQAFHSGPLTGMSGGWNDEIYLVEIGGATTMKRRFTVRGRCLLEQTAETTDEARDVASTLRSRIEHTLLGLRFTGVSSSNESVTMPVRSDSISSELYQSGGPDAYDFHIKVRFEVLTTITGVT